MGRQMRLDQYISTYVELTRKEAKEADSARTCLRGWNSRKTGRIVKLNSEEDVTYCGKEIRAEEFV